MAGEVDLAAQLRPARLPADFFAVSMNDLLAAFGVGVLAAVVLYLLLRPFTRRRTGALARVGRELEQIGTLPSQERLFRQAAILAQLRRDTGRNDEHSGDHDGPGADWRHALYRPDVPVDHDALDQRILRIAARLRT